MYADTISGHEDNHEELKSQSVEIVALNPDVFNSWVWSGSVQDHVNKMTQLRLLRLNWLPLPHPPTKLLFLDMLRAVPSGMP